ncbi:L,D-transpeptidase [Methyloceanibacter sp.]|uniref:L,D-transpeptidase n=1 Tax=Methyloceanibacter sp. TaxID=1965321 RepID=UPI002C7EB57B|nr:L,D-transpeptidase [Methyloceanibacter sp.]HML93064.1 L,D-transpeptidase [Methyloceanibacter sp.]
MMRRKFQQHPRILGLPLTAAGLAVLLLASPASAETGVHATSPDLDLSLPKGLDAQPQPVYPGGDAASSDSANAPEAAEKPVKSASRPDPEDVPSASEDDSEIEMLKSDDAAEVVEPQSPIVVATIDKTTQEMTVFVDGAEKYRWPVSTGMPGYATPSGDFTASSMNKIWYSKQWDNAPMPHAVFFTKKGHAIHATNETKKLGTPASHGCVRLSPKNAETFFNLVKDKGLKRTEVVLTGSTPGGDYKVAQPERRYDPYQDYRRPNYQGYYNRNYQRYGYNEIDPRVQRKRRRIFQQPYYDSPPRQYRRGQQRRGNWFRAPGY